MSVAYDRHGGEDVSVIRMTASEFRHAVQTALRSLNLTYEELADQARRREFSSPRAQKLWVAIGGTRR